MKLAKFRNVAFYFAIITLLMISSFGCNLSDDTEKLPGGHTYVNEGRCYKYILVSIKGERNIESCVSDYKYDDNYITVTQIDTLQCEQSTVIKNEDKKFFIIDNKNEKLLGPFSQADFKVQFDKLKISKDLFLE